VAARFGRLAGRVRRSRTLRWLTAGVGILDPEHADRFGVGGPARRHLGDVHDRMLGWLADAEAALAGDRAPEGPRGPLGPGPGPSRALLEALPSLLVGAELASARLLVASLDPDPDELVGAAVVAAGHG
jgi:hypothetical protein